MVDNFQGPKWIPDTGIVLTPIHAILFFYTYIPVNLQKHCMTSLWHIHISGITTLVLWSHSQVKQGGLEHKHCNTTVVDLIT